MSRRFLGKLGFTMVSAQLGGSSVESPMLTHGDYVPPIEYRNSNMPLVALKEVEKLAQKKGGSAVESFHHGQTRLCLSKHLHEPR